LTGLEGCVILPIVTVARESLAWSLAGLINGRT